MANIVVDDTFNVTQPEVEKTDKVINTFMNGWYKRLLSNDNYLNNQTNTLSTKITNTDSKVVLGSKTIYVSIDGNDNGAGTQTSPYKTIAKALSVAPVTSNGVCTINIMTAGTYDNINISGSKVTIYMQVEGIIVPSINVGYGGNLTISGKEFTVYSSKNTNRIAVRDESSLHIRSVIVTSVSSSTENSYTAILAVDSYIYINVLTVNDNTGYMINVSRGKLAVDFIKGAGNTGTVFYARDGGVICYGSNELTGYETLVLTEISGVVLTGKLNTTTQDLIGAINEVKTTADNNTSSIKKSQTKIQLTLLASSWSLKDNVYYISVLCSSVTSASMTGSFGISYTSIDTSSLTDKKAYLKQSAYIYASEITTVGYVNFKAVKLPTIDIKVWITLEG